MPSNERPVRPIEGTTLIRALDVHEVKALLVLAENKTAWDRKNDGGDYARGVRDLLAWFDGGKPSAGLAELLKIEREGD